MERRKLLHGDLTRNCLHFRVMARLRSRAGRCQAFDMALAEIEDTTEQEDSEIAAVGI